jgi:Outer membrane protein beta-barrel domain
MKKLLENAEMRPSPGVWDRIEKNIPVRSARKTKYKYAAAILFLVTSSVGTFMAFDHFLHPGGGDLKAASKKIQQNKYPINHQKNPGLASDKSYTHTNVPTSNAAVNKPLPGVNNTSANAAVPAYNLQQAVEVRNPANKTVQIYSASGNMNSSVAAGAGLASDTDPVERSYSNTIPPVLTENAGTGNSISVTASLNRQEYNRIREEAEYLVSVEPVKSKPLPNTGINILVSLLPEPKEPVEAIQEPSDKQSLLKAHADKQKHQQKMSQFKIYDVVRGFHIGAFFGFNSSWLTRKNDHREMEHNTIRSRVHIGTNYGVIIGYDYTERWGLQLELAIQSMQGMRYDEFCPIYGLSHKQLNLGYLKIPLMVKYKLAQVNRPDKRPIVMSVLAGPQFSLLHKKELLVEGEPIPMNKSIINYTELGAQAGLDMDFYLHKNMYLTVGTRFGMNSPLQKSRPMSFQFGVLTQFNFRKPPRE